MNPKLSLKNTRHMTLSRFFIAEIYAPDLWLTGRSREIYMALSWDTAISPVPKFLERGNAIWVPTTNESSQSYISVLQPIVGHCIKLYVLISSRNDNQRTNLLCNHLECN